LQRAGGFRRTGIVIRPCIGGCMGLPDVHRRLFVAHAIGSLQRAESGASPTP